MSSTASPQPSSVPRTKGKLDYRSVLEGFYGDFDRELSSAETALNGVHLKVPDEVTDEICEKCGAKMIYKMGKYGKFLACPNYPKCTNIKALDEEKSTEKCGGEMVLKQGKFGKYLQCVDCHNTKSNAKHEYGGVGLHNVTKRLELIYGNDYSLDIKDGEVDYDVLLNLPIKRVDDFPTKT